MKTQKKGPQRPSAPGHSSEKLDEKLTHLTEEVAKTANRFRVPFVVAIVAIVAIIALSGLVTYMNEQQEEAWSEEIYTLFEKDDAAIRADAPSLQDELEGQRIEPAFVAQYARWLFEQNQPGDRQSALALVDAAAERHPDSLLLDIARSEFRQVYEASQGFTLPPIPVPETPAGAAGAGGTAGAAGAVTPTPVTPTPVENVTPSGEGDAATPDGDTTDGDTTDGATDESSEAADDAAEATEDPAEPAPTGDAPSESPPADPAPAEPTPPGDGGR